MVISRRFDLPISVPEDTNCNNIKDAIVPVLRRCKNNQFEVLGTAFFIANRVLLTARHLFDETELGIPFIAQFISGREFSLVRLIEQLSFSNNNSDIALAVVENYINNTTGKELRNASLILTSGKRTVEDSIFTFAYTKNKINEDELKTVIDFSPRYYQGQLVEYFERRDFMLPTPSWRTNMHILAGASGGPVFNSSGHVFAINSSSYHEETNLSFISEINPLFYLAASNANINNQKIHTITIQELINQNKIKIENT